MTTQDAIELALVALLDTHIVGDGNTEQGGLAPSQVEGRLRTGSVRLVSARARRLAFGQLEWADTIQLSVFWRAPEVTRGERVTEWQAFTAALIADQYLGGSIVGLQDSFLSSFAWGEATDAAFVTVAAELQTLRVE